MDIKPREITIRDVVAGYVDNQEEGVVGYSGKLNIRPKYQREFIYEGAKRAAVIDTILKGYPLNVMYWAVNDDGSYEVLDGQQRTISLCQFVKRDFSVMVDGNPLYFDPDSKTHQEKILDYKLMIYFCDGNEEEKLKWFETINIAGERLTDQELRNAVYTGTWLTHAKSIFSKRNCAAYRLAKDYVTGSPIRQEFLQTAIRWISSGDIKKYMSIHQQDPNANELWTYFQNVINWVTLTFTKYRKEMKGIDWGALYDKYKGELLDAAKLEEKIAPLMMDDCVTNKKGIYSYVLSGNERTLSIRAFSATEIREAYERQAGICTKCGAHFALSDMQADHITPWSKGGRTTADNCQMLCADCNRRKSDV
jgi:hypothetical protein